MEVVKRKTVEFSVLVFDREQGRDCIGNKSGNENIRAYPSSVTVILGDWVVFCFFGSLLVCIKTVELST